MVSNHAEWLNVLGSRVTPVCQRRWSTSKAAILFAPDASSATIGTQVVRLCALKAERHLKEASKAQIVLGRRVERDIEGEQGARHEISCLGDSGW